MGRKVLVACDDTPHSRTMVDVAFQHAVHHQTDEVHLVTVLPPPAAAAAIPLAPLATSAVVNAMQYSNEAQQQHDVEKAQATLKLVTDLIAVDYKVPRDSIQTHVLPSEGGASGVSEAVLHLARDLQADLLVVGNRGMGAVKSSIMSLVGLGSVSDALLHHSPCPLLLVRSDPSKQPLHGTEATPPPLQSSKRVCIAYDASPISEAAMLWALDNVLTAHDHLYVVSVALSPPLLVLDEEATLAAMQAQNTREQMTKAVEAASAIVDKGVELAVSHGVTKTKVLPACLTPSGGANEVGHALVTFAKDKDIDVVVAGCRGMGAVQRNLLNFVGLGSVSEYLAHNLHCALAVVRDGVNPAKAMSRPSESLAFHVIREDEGEEPS